LNSDEVCHAREGGVLVSPPRRRGSSVFVSCPRRQRSLCLCHSRAGGSPEVKMRSYYIYILASERNGTLYVGVTNNIKRRVYEHKQGSIPGFTKKYNVHQLVYFEETNNIRAALAREKQLKKWNRAWKMRLIEKNNPEWNDLQIS
jgi:putative endonuclease